MTMLSQDLKYSLRTLAKSPGWTAVAVLTLALGVGANTTVFSWVRGVLLDPIPGASEPGSLRALYGVSTSGETVGFSYPSYRDLAERKGVFEGLLAQRWVSLALGVRRGGSPQTLSGALVSGNYFEVLGVRPALGRSFRPEEDGGRGAPPVMVLSHSLWERTFDSDPTIAGKAVTLNGQPFTVVGVAPEGFLGSFLGIDVDAWTPLAQTGRLEPGGDRLEQRSDRWLLCLGRLKKGVTEAETQAALAAEAGRLSREFPDSARGYEIRAATLGKSPWGAPDFLRPVLLTLLALVGLVLLITCANIANLLLSRAMGRRREIAVRLALGANRFRLVRQFLTESLLLALFGGTLAVVLTFWTAGLLLSFLPPTGRPVRMDLAVNESVLLFALVVSTVSSFLFGLLPALQASRSAIAGDLASTSGSVAGVRGRARLRGALVVIQLALSLVLLVAAGLFLRSLAASRDIDPGFDSRRMLLVGADLFPLGYSPERGLAFYERLEDRARAIPGVRGAAIARRVPLGFGGSGSSVIEVSGYAPKTGEEVMVRYNIVSAGYFRTMGTVLRQGREFERSDREESLPVAVVNEAFARRYFAGRDPVGGRLRWNGTWRQVAGVVADGKYQRLDEAPLPFMFFPLAQAYRPQGMLHLRTAGDPAAAFLAVREVFRQLDPNLPILSVQTMEQHLQEALLAQRVASGLLGVLGLMALLIASVGLYGVAAYAVADRLREIGVRMALGAAPREILRTFLAGGLKLALLGVAIGLAAALAVARLMSSVLPGVQPSDPVAYAGVILVVTAIALAATYLPARRAARVDPIEALRHE